MIDAYIVLAVLVAAVICLVVVLAFYLKSGDGFGPAPSLEVGRGAGGAEGSPDSDGSSDLVINRFAVPGDSQETAGIPLVDVSHLERPSPERPITDEDAALIDIIRQSPELPSAIIELSHMLRDPSASIKRVVQLISTDPVLSAKVLRVVNSAAYGQLRVTSLQQAVVLLGFNNIWLLVNQMLTSSAVKPFAEISQEEMVALWRHAAASAVCARHILFGAGLATSEMGPTVFTCSLLHDVGKFLLRGLGGKGESGVQDEDGQCEMFSVLKEDEVYGLDHCRMGYLLSTYWKLPELICTTIGYHHHPSFGNWHEIPKHARETVAFVALSDCLAKMAGYWGHSPCAFKIPEDALIALGLDKIKPINKLLTKDLKRDLRLTEKLIEAAATDV